MEKNRSIIFRVIGSVMVLGAAAALLFGVTGLVKDPAIETATKVDEMQKQKSEPPQAKAEPTLASAQQATPQQGQPADPGASASSSGGSDDGSTEGTVAIKDDSEPFPQFDDEPTGS